jgi:hypothetical protein
MASVHVNFSSGFPWRRISRRAICFSVVVRDRRRRGEAAPVDSATKLGSSCGVLMLIGGGWSAESCSGGIRNSAEKGISWRANCLVFAPAVFEICRAPCVFLYCFVHFPKVMVRVAISRS